MATNSFAQKRRIEDRNGDLEKARVNAGRLRQGLSPQGLNVLVHLNIGCNAHCVMCALREDYKPGRRSCFPRLRRTLSFLSWPSVARVTLIGGEPFLEAGEFLKTVEMCRKKNFDIEVFTNGCFLEPRILKKLDALKKICLVVSLHGLGENHDRITGVPGHFEAIRRGLVLIKDSYRNIRPCISTVVMKSNAGHMASLGKFLSGIGVREWRLLALEPVRRSLRALDASDEDIRGMKRALDRAHLGLDYRYVRCSDVLRDKDGRCLYLLNKLYITGDGKVLPCRKNIRNPHRLDRPLGDLYRVPEFRHFIVENIKNCRLCFSPHPECPTCR
ncbi:MAG: radical SAM protein [Candidatus Omnitrophica bacterium]|nr:radical SAM protein [Candidatus Omnitrophota bacterium]